MFKTNIMKYKVLTTWLIELTFFYSVLTVLPRPFFQFKKIKLPKMKVPKKIQS